MHNQRSLDLNPSPSSVDLRNEKKEKRQLGFSQTQERRAEPVLSIPREASRLAEGELSLHTTAFPSWWRRLRR